MQKERHAKPVYFDNDMVLAVRSGIKTAFRLPVRPQPQTENIRRYHGGFAWSWWEDGDAHEIRLPYKEGDVLYVKETWAPVYADGTSDQIVGYMYLADEGMGVAEYDRRFPNGKGYTWPGVWSPSARMPKKAARIFLLVKDVRVERLKAMTASEAMSEGFSDWNDLRRAWNKRIKRTERDQLGWDADPWTGVFSFERIDPDVL